MLLVLVLLIPTLLLLLQLSLRNCLASDAAAAIIVASVVATCGAASLTSRADAFHVSRSSDWTAMIPFVERSDSSPRRKKTYPID